MDATKAGASVPYPEYKTPQQLRQNFLVGAKPGQQIIDDIQQRELDRPAGKISVRIYHPAKSGPALPVLVYIHGGCWFLNPGLETHDGLMRSLCLEAHVVVVGVDYRLAPEHKFPVGLEDCYYVCQWASQNGSSFNGDGSKLAVAGDSCGGNLTIAVSMLAKERGGPKLALQVPMMPMTDSPYPGTPSLNEYYSTGFGYEKSVNDWGWELYGAMEPPHGTKDKPNPLAAVLQAPSDMLAGLTPAHVVLAQCDIVRDEGAKYVDKVKAAGGKITVSEYEGCAHGFMSMAASAAPALGLKVDKGTLAIQEVAHKLKAAFASSQ